MGLKYLSGVVSLSLEQEKCRGCGRCTEVCPHRVFELKDNRATMINRDACMECGACAQNCPFAAISVESGVGCAYALIMSLITEKKASCSCS